MFSPVVTFVVHFASGVKLPQVQPTTDLLLAASFFTRESS